VRKWKEADSVFFAEFAAAIDIICRETKLIPVYVVMDPKRDKVVSEHLASLNSKGYVVRSSDSDIEKILTVVRSATAVISMMLHTVIFAAAFGIPMVGISYDPKVKGFLNDVFKNDD
jgi:polysaccharide pyruvyl transferase WcaK-like protein